MGGGLGFCRVMASLAGAPDHRHLGRMQNWRQVVSNSLACALSSCASLHSLELDELESVAQSSSNRAEPSLPTPGHSQSTQQPSGLHTAHLSTTTTTLYTPPSPSVQYLLLPLPLLLLPLLTYRFLFLSRPLSLLCPSASHCTIALRHPSSPPLPLTGALFVDRSFPPAVFRQPAFLA